MPFDPQVLLDLHPLETRYRIDPARVMLYALGIGAEELAFVYEAGLQVLPTMAGVMASPGFIWGDPVYQVTGEQVLHAETSVTLHQPLPIVGDVIGHTRFGPILDKGADKGALLYQTREIHSVEGKHLATVRNTSFLRGDGGYGGSAEPQPAPYPIPQRGPDLVETFAIPANLAKLYRLSGDFNPLHIDPVAARSAGFDLPVLHGLATFGIAGRAVVKALADNDPARIKRIDARFSALVFPGETLETAIWHDGTSPGGNPCAAYRCRVVERDQIVLDHGYAEYA